MSPAPTWLKTSLAAATAVAGLVALGGGCSVSGLTAASFDETGLNPVDAGGGDGNLGTDDATNDSKQPPGIDGSPLCNASHTGLTCYPDNPQKPQFCNMAPDGGTYDQGAAYNDASDAILACHVRAPNGTVTTACAPAGAGTDGSPCTKGTDCNAGYECVGSGTCQHYCCDGVCLGGSNANGKDLFCDIQPMTEATSTKVPVCMLLHPCKLLADPGSCGDGQTCSIARPEDGTTSCVAVGAAKAGDDCERDHCGKNLVCLGTAGHRQCYALCHVQAPVECSQAQKCKTGLPLFQDPAIGYCQ